MSRKDDARPHLAKAQEYVDAARVALECGHNNAASSVTSSDAQIAVKRAERLYDAARDLFNATAR